MYIVKHSLPADGNLKLQALSLPVDGSHGPCNTNTKENVHSVWASHIANGGVSGVVLDGSDFASEGVWNCIRRRNYSSARQMLARKWLEHNITVACNYAT